MPLVKSDYGGVLLVGAQANRDIARLEVARGGATGVTSGTIVPDSYYHSSLTGQFRHRGSGGEPVDIRPSVVRELITTAESLSLGEPADIEWLARQGRYWIVQHRPVVG